MNIDIIKKVAPEKTPFVVIHGTPGIGKTTFAANFPSPLFILTEDGLGINEVNAFPLCKTYDEVMDYLRVSAKTSGKYKTLVIDSLSAMEMLIWDKVCKDHGKSGIEDIGYAKGYIYAVDYWRKISSACRHLLEIGVFEQVVLIAHTEISRFENPESESYDRYQIKLHKRAFHHFYEQADIIGFASQPIYVKKVDGDSRSVATKKGENKLYLTERPSFIAKNRYAMPDSVSLNANEFLKALKGEIKNG